MSQKQTPKRKSGGPGLRSVPGISKLLSGRPAAALARRFGRELVTSLLREVVEEIRQEILAGTLDGERRRRALSGTAIVGEAGRRAEALLAPRPRTVINATGVVVHTNLGRSLLSAEAAEAVARTARDYVDLEYDVALGRRGSRMAHLEPLMRQLFPGHGFVVVNNNAAGIMLCLSALAKRKEVLISRGELVEIGGSFRVPDILAAAGARLREVGTTNRTRVSDYRAALGDRTGLILKVHTSNFRIVGFTEEVPIDSLSRLAGRSGVPLVVDWGSGDLVDLGPLGIDDELPIARVLEAGADLVTFSGDKLLGGPQAGFVVGRPELIERLRRNPLFRVCRLDRLLIAALQQTLAAYVGGRAFETIPTLRMLAIPVSEIEARAQRLRRRVARGCDARGRLTVIDGISRSGGGSSPTGERPTRLLAVECPGGRAGRLEKRLRAGDPPLIGRVKDGRLLLDLRTVPPEHDRLVAELLVAALGTEPE